MGTATMVLYAPPLGLVLFVLVFTLRRKRIAMYSLDSGGSPCPLVSLRTSLSTILQLLGNQKNGGVTLKGRRGAPAIKVFFVAVLYFGWIVSAGAQRCSVSGWFAKDY